MCLLPTVLSGKRCSHCIMCGSFLKLGIQVEREGYRCDRCGSTWRQRAVAAGVLSGLGYPIKALSNIHPDWSRIGLFTSDSPDFVRFFSAIFTVTNTHYDRFPFLDLMQVDRNAVGSVEFAVCSDVFEHVSGDYRQAMRGLKKTVRPGGFVVVSVPMTSTETTSEIYPELVSFDLGSDGSLIWRDSKDEEHFDPNPEIHSGGGLELCFRHFGAKDFLQELSNAGFSDITEVEPNHRFGVPPLCDGSLGGIYIARVRD